MQYFRVLAICIALSGARSTVAETWRLKSGQSWESTTAGPDEQYLQAVADIKKLVQEGDARGARDIARQLKSEFPDRIGPDLDLFVDGELRYWSNHYGKALTKYEKLLKKYPGSEFADLVLQREYDMATAYLQGRKKTVLGVIKISGDATGVAIMEKISDRAGIDEPDGMGLNAAIAVAEHYEQTRQYLEAYLKWSEIASYWETGPIGKRAMYRMAEDNFDAYNLHPEAKRPRFDASKLTTAKTYYEKYQALYPDDARNEDVPAKLKTIDEEMAFKQFTIGKYYRHIGKNRAAYLYFDMVIESWPKTEAAEMARQAIEEIPNEGKASGR